MTPLPVTYTGLYLDDLGLVRTTCKHIPLNNRAELGFRPSVLIILQCHSRGVA